MNNSPIKKIITIPKSGNSTIMGIIAPVGSRYEPNEIKGISHFIEHLAFKGTEKRNANQISSEIENLGGDLNAYTDEEITCYWIKIANKYNHRALDVLMDFVTHPIFPPKEINKEREVIIQEMKMYEDNPKSKVYDIFNSKFFTKNSGLSISVIGTKKSLYNIDRKKIIDFYTKYYNNLTLLMVGDVDKKTSFKHNNNYYPFKMERLLATNASFFETNSQIKQANLLIGNYFYLPYFDGLSSFKLELLSAIYNDMSGRLFSQIREKNNLCYGIHFNNIIYGDNLISWKVSIGLDKEKINKAINLITNELVRPFSKKEIEIALQKSIGSYDLYYDNNKNLFNTIAYCEAKNVNWEEQLNYRKNLKKAKKNLNDFREGMNFNRFLTVGIMPK